MKPFREREEVKEGEVVSGKKAINSFPPFSLQNLSNQECSDLLYHS